MIISYLLAAGKCVVGVGFWREIAFKRQICGSDKQESREKAFKRSAEKLQELNKIGVWDSWVWIP